MHPASIADGPRSETPRPTNGRLKRRAEFLHVAKGRRWHGVAMTIQAAERAAGIDGETGVRFGFTVTKKVGNAVVRNRARRRLREAVRLAADQLPVKAGYDHVIVGRLDALRVSFAALQGELLAGLGTLGRPGRSHVGSRGGQTPRATIEAAAAADRAAPDRIRPRP